MTCLLSDWKKSGEESWSRKVGLRYEKNHQSRGGMRILVLLLISSALTGCISETDHNHVNADDAFRAAPEEDADIYNLNLAGTDSEADDSHVNTDDAFRAAPEELNLAGTDKEVDNKEKMPPENIRDWTLPENTFFDNSTNDTAYIEPPKLFEDKKLFNQKKKKGNISMSVAPSLKLGEELTDIPEIDGGSVTVEVKTK
jgi:hypothetical protein